MLNIVSNPFGSGSSLLFSGATPATGAGAGIGVVPVASVSFSFEATVVTTGGRSMSVCTLHVGEQSMVPNANRPTAGKIQRCMTEERIFDQSNSETQEPAEHTPIGIAEALLEGLCPGDTL